MTLFDDDNPADGLADELTRLAEIEAQRLREELPNIPAALEPLIDAAATLHARRVVADRRWVAEGADPRSAWLRVSTAALRDYVRLLETLTSKANVSHDDEDDEDDAGGESGLVLTDADFEQIVRGGGVAADLTIE